METTPKTFNRNNNYPPTTIEDQDLAVVVTTREMEETQYSTQEDAITTNILEEKQTITGDNEIHLSQNEEIIDKVNVEKETTMGFEIQTAQTATSMNLDEDTPKDTNEGTFKDETTTIQEDGTDFETGFASTTEADEKNFTDETTTIQDDETDFGTEDLESTTVEALNRLLWNTLVEEQGKQKPDNYNQIKSKNGELDSDEVYEDMDEFASQEKTKKAVDIKERKYKIGGSTDDKQRKGTTKEQENENSTVAKEENEDSDDEESKEYEEVGDFEDDDFEENYQHADTGKLI